MITPDRRRASRRSPPASRALNTRGAVAYGAQEVARTWGLPQEPITAASGLSTPAEDLPYDPSCVAFRPTSTTTDDPDDRLMGRSVSHRKELRSEQPAGAIAAQSLRSGETGFPNGW
jgi:hypothetical protein